MSVLPKIPRIIFNFIDRCLNGCPFCFIPFDGKGPGELSLWLEIMDRAADFSPELISFSGCDPFYYSDFYTLLETAKKSCYWGVDSSLIWLDRERFAGCASRLDQFSTSWDDVPQMPVFQRYPAKKLALFTDNLDYVRSYLPNTVVHTLYSAKNSDYLPYIADELIHRKIKTWSLYQFWPFDFIKNPEPYLVDETVFNTRGQQILEYVNGRLDFEYVPCKNRANGYFFVSGNGDAYTTIGGAVASYKKLGSIFDADIFEKWHAFSNPSASGTILDLKIKREINNQ